MFKTSRTIGARPAIAACGIDAVSYTHLRAHETVLESRMPSSA